VTANLVCDLDGVVYLGRRPIEGSGEALRLLERASWNILLCTNNSARSPAEVAARVEEITGYRTPPGQVLTSAQAAALMLADSKPPTFVLGGEGVESALAEAGIPLAGSASEAKAVVVGLTVDLTYPWLREAVTAVRGGARLIATNLDPTYPTEDGPWPGGGAIVAAVETASGQKAEPAGKPWPPMRELISRHLVPGPVWVAGDRADTDLAMAAASGWSSALVLTGVTGEGEEVEPIPDLMVENLADLARRLLDT
jgi:HAD superfamily hydrolase (TIGR01450 family)